MIGGDRHLTVQEHERIQLSSLPGGLTAERLVAVQAEDLHDPRKKTFTPFSRVGEQVRAPGRVGVVDVDGVVVEILPKAGHRDLGSSAAGEQLSERQVERSRQVVEALVHAFLQSGPMDDHRSARTLNPTRLQATRGPIRERVHERFVEETEILLPHRVRMGYTAASERLPYLRGRLDLGRQSRQLPGQEHRFHVRYRRFDAARPENRLIKTALLRVASRSPRADLRLRAHQLAGLLDEVPVSHAVAADLAQWDRGRLLEGYRAVEPWCRLTLQPLLGTRVGADQAESLLWRTENLFEKALESALARRVVAVGADLEVVSQAGDVVEHLGTDEAGEAAFRLEPDLLLRSRGDAVAVIDAKWKQHDKRGSAVPDLSPSDDDPSEEAATSTKPRPLAIGREDAYQLFAYGHRYLKGRGPMVVVYPASLKFTTPVTYQLGELTLTALPYDVADDEFLLGHRDSATRRALGDLVPLLSPPGSSSATHKTRSTT
ncbi:McrC family protein [Kineococcus sp. SYSU DK002]|uniref:McrC family protein n=1 Tax=Kineococcus sp. SYSU DK002 TaxID=3383123 RepID=UPI003D7DCC46